MAYMNFEFPAEIGSVAAASANPARPRVARRPRTVAQPAPARLLRLGNVMALLSAALLLTLGIMIAEYFDSLLLGLLGANLLFLVGVSATSTVASNPRRSDY
ncbi:hypothetical protein CLG96_00490 [Sphingomonas oleivorans]|uniref:Uncharacterized protein n=1 Tax=Sphingomonas oleivorans TaxID=1735121 RepID=A0A2T5G0K7_9SPHN|nr:hypothetical protein [Sphingomonas oleivorans]PTQ12682.1 hypothetical protein CLG96_00490 [Sphingomonas oleivorans]